MSLRLMQMYNENGEETKLGIYDTVTKKTTIANEVFFHDGQVTADGIYFDEVLKMPKTDDSEVLKVYQITADDHTLEKTYRHKFDAEQSLKKAGYENEGDDDWSKSRWTESGEAITVIYARIEEVDVL